MRVGFLPHTIAILVAALVASCDRSPGATRTADEPPRTVLPEPRSGAQQTATVKVQMGEHFSKATAAKSAVVRGDLEQSRQAASSLAEMEGTANLRPAWRPHMHRLQEAAREVAQANTISQAAQGVGRIGEACASCHVVVGRPKFTLDDGPDASPGSDFEPVQHVWAVDRMWEGLITSSDEAWRRGAAVLVEAPFEPAVRIAAREVPPDVLLIATRVHDLGHLAIDVDIDRRGGAFGDVLATCATCHQRLDIALP